MNKAGGNQDSPSLQTIRDKAGLLLIDKIQIAIIFGTCTAFAVYVLQHEGVSFIPVLIIIVPCLFIAFWFRIFSGRGELRGDIRLIEVGPHRVSGWTFKGKRLDIRWEEVSRVVIADSSLSIESKGGFVVIGAYFRQYSQIVGLVTAICKEKGISCS